MTKMPRTFKYQRRVWSLAYVGAFLISTYVVLFGMTIYNTSSAQRAERQSIAETAELSKMEFAYLSSQAEINIDLANSMGFVEPERIIVAKASGISSTAFVSGNKIQ